MPNVSPLSCWTRPGTRGVGVGGVADFYVAVNKNERVFGDKLERLQTEALFVAGRGWVELDGSVAGATDTTQREATSALCI